MIFDASRADGPIFDPEWTLEEWGRALDLLSRWEGLMDDRMLAESRLTLAAERCTRAFREMAEAMRPPAHEMN